MTKRSGEYETFKSLLGRVLSVPHSEIVRRETEYKKQAALNPHKRGPKSKRKSAGPDPAV
jgi:hypothetical protein